MEAEKKQLLRKELFTDTVLLLDKYKSMGLNIDDFRMVKFNVDDALFGNSYLDRAIINAKNDKTKEAILLNSSQEIIAGDIPILKDYISATFNEMITDELAIEILNLIPEDYEDFEEINTIIQDCMDKHQDNIEDLKREKLEEN